MKKSTAIAGTLQALFLLVVLLSSTVHAQPGVLDLNRLDNYANQPVPAHINATPEKSKDNTTGRCGG